MTLSIITINLNNRDGLQKTIESVESQDWHDYEYIIIDGGSTDGSRELIEQKSELFSYWVSEPDKGIYNAMNKGIRQAKGEYCLLLNSGDYFWTSHALSDLFSKGTSADIIYADIMLVGGGKNILK